MRGLRSRETPTLKGLNISTNDIQHLYPLVIIKKEATPISRGRLYYVKFSIISSQIKAIQIHHFCPCCYKIIHKFLTTIGATIYFGKGAKLGI